MRKLHFAFGILLCGASLTATSQEVFTEEFEGPSTTIRGDLRDLMRTSKPASPLRVRQQAEEEEETTGEAYTYQARITNMPKFLHAFINSYVEAGQAVLDGGTSWLSDPKEAEYESNAYFFLVNEEIETVDFTFEPGSTSDAIKKAAQKAVQKETTPKADTLSSFLPYAFLCANYDHPEFFWIGNSFMFGTSTSISMRYNATGTGTATYTMKAKFILRTNDFDIRSNGYNNYDFRQPKNILAAVERFYAARDNILKLCQKKRTTYYKLLAAHDWLTLHNCYNRYFNANTTPADLGNMPWCPMSALEGNSNNLQSPVCEGYARAMKVLCDAMDIPCILMGGNAFDPVRLQMEAHMWNYIQVNDSTWCALDATWDDPVVAGVNSAVSGHESHEWFLLGSNSQLSGGTSFIDSHPEQWPSGYENKGTIIWETTPWPTLSAERWRPDPYDPNGDAVTDKQDIQLMAKTIVNNGEDIEDVDGNGRISVGDLVRMIIRYNSESNKTEE
ncbi:MAG: hypothetical protein IJ615_02940 [Bacteroidaceae bacterium]|nr:hypothetical protein [Bacteroidaceae bacterium]